jgi:thioredoxin 1
MESMPEEAVPPGSVRRRAGPVPALALLCAAVAVFGLRPDSAAPQPYDPELDPAAALASALERAEQADRLVLLNFGANWCPACRRVTALMESAPVDAYIDGHFEVVKVDVGRGGRNRAFVVGLGDPIAAGIPAAVVLRADGSEVLGTRRGELGYLAAAEPARLETFLRAVVQESITNTR